MPDPWADFEVVSDVVSGSSTTAPHDPWADFEVVDQPKARREPGSYPAYDVPLPDPGVVAATAPFALAPAGIGALAGIPARAAATTVGKVAGEIGAGYLADKGLGAVGVPSEARAALLAMYGMGRLGGAGIGRRVGAAMRGKPAPAAAAPAPSVPKGASTTGTPSAATIPNVRVSTGSAPAVAKAAPAAQTAAAELPEAATFYGDKVWRVGDRVFNNAKDALQHSHSLKRAGTASKVIAQTVPAVEKAVVAPTVAKTVVSGKEVAAKHAALVQFAKEVAATRPKVGQKIWMLLDEGTGLPIKHLTPDQAGAATRAGKSVTWAKNLWD